MASAETLLGWACVALEGAILTGLVARQRVQQCYGLFLLVPGWTIATVIARLCRDCYTWDFWIAKELIHAVLAFGVALELCWRVFRRVPRAWFWARMAVIISMAMGVVLVVSMPPGPISVRVIPWILAALAWLYTLLGVTLALLEMPSEVLHRATLWSLAPYFMLYAATWALVQEDVLLPAVVNPAMFTLVLIVLLWAAWRREIEVPAGHPETVRWLWPWRS